MRYDEHVHIRHWAAVADIVVDRIDFAVAGIATGRTDMLVVGIGILLVVAVRLIVGHMAVVAAATTATEAAGKAEETRPAWEVQEADCRATKEVAAVAEDMAVVARSTVPGARMHQRTLELEIALLPPSAKICSCFVGRIVVLLMASSRDTDSRLRMKAAFGGCRARDDATQGEQMK